MTDHVGVGWFEAAYGACARKRDTVDDVAVERERHGKARRTGRSSAVVQPDYARPRVAAGVGAAVSEVKGNLAGKICARKKHGGTKAVVGGDASSHGTVLTGDSSQRHVVGVFKIRVDKRLGNDVGGVVLGQTFLLPCAGGYKQTADHRRQKMDAFHRSWFFSFPHRPSRPEN